MQKRGQEAAAIVSKNCKIRYRDIFVIKGGTIVDDFCYFSVNVQVGKYCHIGNNVTIGGGRNFLFSLGDYSSISAGVRIWCRSNDYVHDLVVCTDKEIGDEQKSGDVRIGRCFGIGANSVIMPDQDIPEGVVIGALSFVPSRFRFKPWSVYAGIPIRRIKARDKERVLGQVKRMEE